MKRTSGLILTLALVITLLVSVFPAGVSVADTASTMGITPSKTATWTDTEKTELEIKIEEDRTATNKYPKILFVGTLCNRHSLTMQTVWESLAATSEYGVVDVYLYGNDYRGGDPERIYRATIDTTSLKRINYASDADYDAAVLAAVKATPVTVVVDSTSDTPPATIGDLAMVAGQHASVYDFAELFASFQKNNIDYDYMVFEFDGMRLGHITTVASGLTTITADTYPSTTDKNNLVAASEWIAKYYESGSIAWVIPEKNVNTGDNRPSGTLNKYMYNEYHFDHVQGTGDTQLKNTMPVRDTIFLLAPEDISAAEKAAKSVASSETIEDQTTFKARATDTTDDGIWVTYDNAQNVRIFLDRKLGQYFVTVKDVVSAGLTVKSIKGQYSNDGGTTWTDITANATTGTDADKLTVTQTTNPDGSTAITGVFNLKKVYSNYQAGNSHDVQLVISCDLAQKDPDAVDFIFTKENNYTIETNKGDVEITYTEGPLEEENKKETPTVTKIPDYTVSYNLVEHNGINPPTTDKPEDDTMAAGTEYTSETQPDIPGGYTFSGWYTDEACTTKYADGTEIIADTPLYGYFQLATSLTKAASSASAANGDTLTYTITVKNDSASAVTVDQVTDVLDENLDLSTVTFTNASPLPFATAGKDSATRTLKWTDITVPAGGETRLTYTVKVKTKDSAAQVVIKNNATLVLDGNTVTTTPAETSVNPTVSYQLVKKGTDGIDVPTGASAPDPETVTYNTGYTSKDPVTPGGYDFDGWYTDPDCTTPYTDNTPITKDTVLYGAFEVAMSLDKSVTPVTASQGTELTYTITVKNDSDSAATVSEVTDPIDTDKLDLSTVTFTNSAPLPYASADKSTSTLKWTNVQVPANGTTALTFTVKVRSDIAEPKTITNKANANFDGHTLTSPEASTGVTPTVDITYNLVKKDLASVPTTDKPADDTVAYNTAYTSKTQPTVPGGYTFDGWYTDEACTTKYTDGTQLTKDTPLYGYFTLAMSLDKSVTPVTATQGTELTYTVTVKNDSASAATVSEVTDPLDTDKLDLSTVTFTNSAPLPYASADKSTSTLKWTNVQVPANGTTALTFTVKVRSDIAEPKTITNKANASFDGNTLTSPEASTGVTPKINVSYNLVKKDLPSVPTTDKPANDTIDYDTAYTSKTQPTVPSGYVFDGWYTDEACTVKYVDGTQLTKDTPLYGYFSVSSGLDKTVSSEPAANGDTLTYSIKVTNSTSEDMTVDSITDTLDANLDATSVQYIDSTPSATLTDRTLEWKNVSVPKNSSVTLTYTVKVKLQATAVQPVTIINTAKAKIGTLELSSNKTEKPLAVRVSYQFKDKDGVTVPSTGVKAPDDDVIAYNSSYTSVPTDSAEVTVPAGYLANGWYTDPECTIPYTTANLTADTILYGYLTKGVTLDKDVDKADAAPGEVLTYTVTVVNASEQAVTLPTVTDTLSSDLDETTAAFTNSGSPLPYASASRSGNVLTWTDVQVPARVGTTNGTATLTFTVEVSSAVSTPVTISNQATTNFGGSTVTSPAAETEVTPVVEVNYVLLKKDLDPLPVNSTDVPASDTVSYNTAYTAKDQTVLPAGYTFHGWYSDDQGTIAYVDGTEIKTNTTLYGYFTLEMALEKKVDQTSANQGDTLTYTLTLKNTSSQPATVTKVEDTLDSYLTFAAFTPSTAYESASNASGVLTWTNITVPANGTVDLVYTATIKSVPSTVTKVSNSAKATFDGREIPSQTIDTDIVPQTATYNLVTKDGIVPPTTTVPVEDPIPYDTPYTSKPQPDVPDGYVFKGWYTDPTCTTPYTDGTPMKGNLQLYGYFTLGISLEKKAVPDVATPGSTVTYSITVKNDSDNEAVVTSVTDTLDSRLEFIGFVPSTAYASANHAGGVLTWDTVTVPAKGSVDLSFTVKISKDITSAVTIQNNATAVFDGHDITPDAPSELPITIPPKTGDNGWAQYAVLMLASLAAMLLLRKKPRKA